MEFAMLKASPTATRKFPPASVRGQGDQSTDKDAGASHPKLAAYIRHPVFFKSTRSN